MPHFDARFWNLSQAAAWVVYRTRTLVEQFSEQSADGWRGLIMYPGMHKREGSLNELVDALARGDLTAWGRPSDIKGKLEEIPAREWADLGISPPSVKRSQGQNEPWADLRFESKDLKKRWRGLSETEGRTFFKWDVLERMWHEINELHPDLSQNDRIGILQFEYEAKYRKEPSRSSIQTHIKRWAITQTGPK